MADTDTSKLLDAYILDYMIKKNLHASAKTFMKEGKIPKRSAVDVIDAPAGFLCEWWTVFWDMFLAKTNAKCSDAAASYLKTQQLKDKEKQIQCDILNLQMMHELKQQQTPDMRYLPCIRSDPGVPDHILRQPAASTGLYAELPRHGYARQLDYSAYLDASQNLGTSHTRDVAQVERRNLSMASKELYPPPSWASSNIGDLNFAINNKTGSPDPPLFGVPADMQPRSKPLTDMCPGLKPLPLSGWPLLGSEHLHLHTATASPSQRTDRLGQSKLLMHLQQRQQLTDSPESCRSMLTANCYQPGKGSSVQLASQLVGAVSGNQPVDHPREQLDQQDQGRLLQNCRKRKKSDNLGTAKNSGTDDLIDTSFTSALSSCDAMSAENAAGHSGMSRKYQPNASVGMRGNTHPLGQPAAASLDDDVESFLSHDNDNADDSIMDTLKVKFDPLQVSSLSEVACLRSSSSKVVSCHFSSDGKLLASAGHDKKVLLWNMDTLETQTLPDLHTQLITDVRFMPNSTYLGTSSFDRTLRLWNAAEPLHSVCSLFGHMTQVRSLDFHQTNEDILCSCDDNGEIRLWSIKEGTTHHIIKGGSSKVRFQPGASNLLAAGADNVVNVFDVESRICQCSLKGHEKDVLSICWSLDGKILASVSEDCVRVWPMTAKRGQSSHKLRSNGNKFQSCVFHPTHRHVVVVSGYQSIELWDLVADELITVAAHDSLIPGLAQSPVTRMIATASHDRCVKLWK